MVSRQRRNLAVDGRYFDAQTFHFGHPQRIEALLHAAFGFAFTQDRFTEQVDVHIDTLALTISQVFAKQLRFGRQNHVRGFAPHFFFDKRNGDTRQVFAERLKAKQHGLFDGTEETWDALNVQQVSQLIGNACRRVSPKGLVGHFHQRRLVVRMADHPIQLRLLPSFLRRLQLNSMP